MVGTALSALVALGMVLVVPQGLRLLGGKRLVVLAKVWPLAIGLPGLLSLTLRPGVVAGLLAAVFGLGCGWLLVAWALQAIRRERRSGPAQVAITALALAAPAVAACALWFDRAGVPLAGLSGNALQLVAAHALFTGFSAAILILLLVRTGDTSGRLTTLAAYLLPAGALVATVGIAAAPPAGNWLALGGAVVCATAIWCVGVVSFVGAALRTRRPVARVLMTLGALTPLTTSVLVVLGFLAVATPEAWPSPSELLTIQAFVSGIGFGLCGLVGWTFFKADPSKARRLSRVRRMSRPPQTGDYRGEDRPAA